MTERTTFLNDLRLDRRGWMCGLLLAFAATACSGGSSGDDESEDTGETVTQRRAPATSVAEGSDDESRNHDRTSGDAGEGDTDDAADDESRNHDRTSDDAKEGDTDDAADETPDLDALIRRLDRLVATTDARLLRSGVQGDTSSLSPEVLEERLQSAKARMHAATAVGEGRP